MCEIQKKTLKALAYPALSLLLRLEWCRLNSFSFRAVACCFNALCNCNLSAASIVVVVVVVVQSTQRHTTHTKKKGESTQAGHGTGVCFLNNGSVCTMYIVLNWKRAILDNTCQERVRRCGSRQTNKQHTHHTASWFLFWSSIVPFAKKTCALSLSLSFWISKRNKKMSSSLDDGKNPWEEAADATDGWSQPQQNSLSFNNNNSSGRASSSREHEGEELITWMVRHWLYVFHLLDIGLGIALIVVVSISFLPINKILEVLTIVLASLLLIRGIFTSVTLFWKKDWTFSYKWSGRISLLLLVLSLVVGLEEILRRVADRHKTVRDQEYIWIVLFSWTALELIRYVCVVNYRQVVTDDFDEDHARVPESTHPNSRPWWWKKKKPSNTTTTTNNALDEPFLGRPGWANTQHSGYQVDDGVSRGGFFANMFAKTNNHHNSNLRDDGSADFASAQEDWASRSEEDPLWWSKDTEANK